MKKRVRGDGEKSKEETEEKGEDSEGGRRDRKWSERAVGISPSCKKNKIKA